MNESTQLANFNPYIDELQKKLTPEIKNKFPQVSLDALFRKAKFYLNKEFQQYSWRQLQKPVILGLSLGLEFDPYNKHAYIIPYKGEPTFYVSYLGMMHLASRSGIIKKIDCRCVYENDDFKVKYINGVPQYEHSPCLNGNRGELTHVWAVALGSNGENYFELMSRQEIDKIKDFALGNKKNHQFSPWVTAYGEMARKTVIRRLAKYLPSEIGKVLNQACEMEDQKTTEEKKEEENVFTSEFEEVKENDEKEELNKLEVQAEELINSSKNMEELKSYVTEYKMKFSNHPERVERIRELGFEKMREIE